MNGNPARVLTAAAFWISATLAMVATCTLGMPRYHCSKDKAYVTAMKSDLRNLVSAQEAFRADHGRFATPADLATGALDFRNSTGVMVLIQHSDTKGWSARTTHRALAKASCAIDSADGEPRCTIAKDSWRPRISGNASLNIAIDYWLITCSLARRRRRLAEAARVSP